MTVRTQAPRHPIATTRPPRRLLCALAVLLLSAAAGQAAPAGPEFRADTSYGPRPQQVLDLCLPPRAAAPRPGVVFLHGGGWSAGDKSVYDSTCRLLATQGFVGATVQYRLADRGNPATWWPGQLADAQLAVRWLRSRAAELGLDPRRICAWGDSAGAQLAMFLGAQPAIAPAEEASLLPDQPPNVQCVIAISGPFDLTTIGDRFRNAVRGSLFGATGRDADPQAYRAASPVFAITAHSAPALLIHGRNDNVVPFSQAEEMSQVLSRNGVAVTLLPNDGGHVLSGLDQQARAKIFAAEVDYLKSFPWR